MAFKSTVVVAVTAPIAVLALQQAASWGQCGGVSYTGPTLCPSGWFCTPHGSYYSQCTTSDAVAAASCPAAAATTPVKPTTKATTAATRPLTTPTVKSTSKSTPSNTATAGGGTVYIASFTEYGSGDANGSPNCNTNTNACGDFTNPGFAVAVSQNLYGVGPGAGVGPACGECWKLTIETDSNGHAVSNAGNSIVVKVTNLCPVDGNPLCAQTTDPTSVNQYGAHFNFDTCIDSGASSALFGDSGVGLGVGTAQQVSCSEWSGTVVT